MHSKLRDTLVYYDHICWYYINNQWHNQYLDAVVPFFRNQWFWAPLYLFLLIFMPYRFGKKGIIWCLVFIASFAISDQISASLLKPIFHRIRPCNNKDLATVVQLLVPCGGGYSFPSSHASNHFAMGVFTSITFNKYLKHFWFVPLLWALVVSLSQVYVGVHYPLDVLGGGILGSIIGLGTGMFFNRYFSLVNSEKSALINE